MGNVIGSRYPTMKTFGRIDASESLVSSKFLLSKMRANSIAVASPVNGALVVYRISSTVDDNDDTSVWNKISCPFSERKKSSQQSIKNTKAKGGLTLCLNEPL
jgi:hypothetical protein